MKLYAVTVKYVAVVAAESPQDAINLADREKRAIAYEVSPKFEVGIINRAEDLNWVNSLPYPPGVVQMPWDVECFPYGDTEHRIGEILPIKEATQ